MQRRAVTRYLQFGGGVALMVVAPVTAPLPGPGATMLFALGLMLVLRSSYRARVRFARAKRRWPRVGALLDRAMRRGSALRRRQRARAAADEPRKAPLALTSRAPSPIGTALSGSPSPAALDVCIEGMSDEADFPAEQSGAGAPPRLPGADGDGGRPVGDPGAPGARPQEAVGLTTLKRRRDFLAANAGRRAPMPGFVLLVRPREDGDPAMRVGFTVTKKIGNSVTRNRLKRRLRALARVRLPVDGVRGADHVLIGRGGGLERDFAALDRDLAKALVKVRR